MISFAHTTHEATRPRLEPRGTLISWSGAPAGGTLFTTGWRRAVHLAPIRANRQQRVLCRLKGSEDACDVSVRRVVEQQGAEHVIEELRTLTDRTPADPHTVRRLSQHTLESRTQRQGEATRQLWPNKSASYDLGLSRPLPAVGHVRDFEQQRPDDPGSARRESRRLVLGDHIDAIQRSTLPRIHRDAQSEDMQQKACPRPPRQ